LSDLIPFPHDEPAALLVAEIKLGHGGGFGRLLAGRVDRA
jgi:hypothetical protein